MANIGDRVTIKMSGPAVLANTATTSGYTTIPDHVSPITVGGKIIREDNDSWVIQLDIPVAGNSQLKIPKAIVE